MAGVCTAGPVIDCSTLDSDCTVGVCTSQGTFSGNCSLQNLPNGTQCTDDGLSCTADQCLEGVCNSSEVTSGCLIQGICVPEGAASPLNSCESCQSAVSDAVYSVSPAGTDCTDDALSCTIDTCDGSGACIESLTSGTCFISGACYDAGALSPSGCSSCQPSINASAWTDLATGTKCNDTDGLTCTSGACNGGGQCIPELDSQFCIIAGACVAAGTISSGNSCQACQPSLSVNSYTSLVDSTPCNDDGNECTSDVCLAGVCNTPITNGTVCGDGNECLVNECQSGACNTAPKSNNTPCTDDGNECTSDVCLAGACNTLLANGTVCGDGNECLVNECQSGACNTAPKSDNTPCTDDGNECTNDVCLSGACNTPLADGAACGDGNECLVNACQAGACDVSSIADGTPCTDDGNECTSDICVSGQCENPVVSDGTACTDDGDDCTADICSNGICDHPAKCVDDGFSCTLESCASGVCTTVIAPDTCFIDDACYASGQEDPGAACRYCVPTSSDSDWTAWADESDALGNCNDGIDNDCDGLTDDADSECVQAP